MGASIGANMGANPIDAIDRIGELVYHATALEFSIKGARLDIETHDALFTLAMAHTAKIRALRDELAEEAGRADPAQAARAPDPVFAAIERHRAARAALDAVSEITDAVVAESAGRIVTDADRATLAKAMSDEDAALTALRTCAPSTRVGIDAALIYLSDRALAEEDALADFCENSNKIAAFSMMRASLSTDRTSSWQSVRLTRPESVITSRLCASNTHSQFLRPVRLKRSRALVSLYNATGGGVVTCQRTTGTPVSTSFNLQKC